MASLGSKKLADTYQGLLNFQDGSNNIVTLSATARRIYSGDGNASTLYLSTSKIGLGDAPSLGDVHYKGANGLAMQKSGSNKYLFFDSANEKLVWKANSLANQNSGLILESMSGTTDSAGFIKFHTAPKDTAYTSTSQSERMRITSEGLVGIGDNNPDELLHVKGGNIKIESGVLKTTPLPVFIDFVNGVDTNNGKTALTPFKTLEKALDTFLSAGSKLHIYIQGTFSTNSNAGYLLTKDYDAIKCHVTFESTGAGWAAYNPSSASFDWPSIFGAAYDDSTYKKTYGINLYDSSFIFKGFNLISPMYTATQAGKEISDDVGLLRIKEGCNGSVAFKNCLIEIGDADFMTANELNTGVCVSMEDTRIIRSDSTHAGYPRNLYNSGTLRKKVVWDGGSSSFPNVGTESGTSEYSAHLLRNDSNSPISQITWLGSAADGTTFFSRPTDHNQGTFAGGNGYESWDTLFNFPDQCKITHTWAGVAGGKVPVNVGVSNVYTNFKV